MNKTLIYNFIGLLLLIVVFVFDILLSFSNPDMTSTRLFLTFWHYYLISFILALCSIMLFRWGVE